MLKFRAGCPASVEERSYAICSLGAGGAGDKNADSSPSVTQRKSRMPGATIFRKERGGLRQGSASADEIDSAWACATVIALLASMALSMVIQETCAYCRAPANAIFGSADINVDSGA